MAFVVDVFLSSTFEDLKAYSDAVYKRLNRHEMFRCTHQRDFGARDAGAVEYCRDRVSKAELYVGLFGMRRGWEPKNDATKRSITEMEHDWAREFGKPRFLYISPSDFSIPGDKPESLAMHRRQRNFRKRVMSEGERVISQKWFETPELLAAEVQTTLLTYVATSNLIEKLRSDLVVRSTASLEEQRPAIAAAVERLVGDKDVKLLTLVKNAKDVDFAGLESKLTSHAEAHALRGRESLRTSAEYWRHVGALARLRDTKKALVAYQNSIELDPNEPDGWRHVGELRERLGELSAAEKCFTHLLELGQAANDLPSQSIAKLRLGRILFDRGDWTQGREFIRDAIKLAEKANWNEGVAKSYMNLGVIELKHGSAEDAERMQLKVLQIGEILGNKEIVADANVHLGLIHYHRGDRDKAEQMQQNALRHYEDISSKHGMSYASASLGVIYYDRGDFDRAEELFRKSLVMSEELGNKEGMAMAHYNLALIHQRKDEKSAMCKSWRRSRDLYHEMSLLNEVAEVENQLRLHDCDGV